MVTLPTLPDVGRHPDFTMVVCKSEVHFLDVTESGVTDVVWHQQITNDQYGHAVGISMICHSVPEIQCTSGLQSAILNCASRSTSGNVGNVTIDLGTVENVGLAVGISMICHSVPEIQCTYGLQSAILNSGSRLVFCSFSQWDNSFLTKSIHNRPKHE